MRLLRWWTWLLLLTIVVGCQSRDLNAVGEPRAPFVLMLSPAHAPSAADRKALEDDLSTRSGLAVEVRVAKTADEAVASAGSKNVDAWLMPLFDYLLCHQEYGITAELQVLRARKTVYAGEILVRKDSGLTDLASLQGKRFAFVDERSTSGFLFPAKLLAEAGVEVEPTFAGSPERALTELRAGRVAAAAVYAGASSEDEELLVVARTEDIPNEPIAFRKALAPEPKEKIQTALIAFAKTDEGKRVLASMAGIRGFTRMDHAAYRDVQGAIQAADKRVQDLVPGGWSVYNENRRVLDDFVP